MLKGGPVSMLVKGIATGIGLASESIHHHKEKKRAQKAQDQISQTTDTVGELPEHLDRREDEVLSRQMDEAAWALDDAQNDLGYPPDARDMTSPEAVPQLAEDFLQHHPLPPAYDDLPPRSQLELPVVITQRRPKERTRGFIRAYAPVLENAGIDQDTFLDFLDQLNKAVEPSPWIQAINLASFAGQAVPEPFTMLVAIATKMVTDAAAEVHSRTKTNSFLDRMNEEFFKPRGLIALLLTWKPTDSSTFTTMDFDLGSTIARETSGSHQGVSKLKHSVQSSSAATAFEFPATAPLVFPTLDQLAAEGNEQAAKKLSTLKRSGKFVTDYMDKRAQAEWAGQNPDSQMANAAPKPQFHSRYADPNHPASSGDPIALLTGGYISSGRGAGGVREGLLNKSLNQRFGRENLLNRRGLGGSANRNETGSGAAGGIGGIGPLSLITGVKKLAPRTSSTS